MGKKSFRHGVITYLEKKGVDPQQLNWLLGTGRLKHDYEIVQKFRGNKLGDVVRNIGEYRSDYRYKLKDLPLSELKEKGYINKWQQEAGDKIIKLLKQEPEFKKLDMPIITQKAKSRKRSQSKPLSKPKRRQIKGGYSPAMQAYHIRLIENKLRNAGVDPQTIDIEAKYDAKLTYTENLQKFKKYFDEKHKVPAKKEQRDRLYAQLKQRHKARSPRSKIMDEKLSNKITRVISKLRSQDIDEWYDDPGRSDIKDIDDPGVYQQRQHKRTIRQQEIKLESRLPKPGNISHTKLRKKFSEKDIETLISRGLIGVRKKKKEYVIF